MRSGKTPIRTFPSSSPPNPKVHACNSAPRPTQSTRSICSSEVDSQRNPRASTPNPLERISRDSAHALGLRKHGPRHAVVIGRKWEVDSSIDGDASSGYCSLDLCYWLSDADGVVAGRPEFEIEHSFIGFSVGRDRVRFVVGEDGREAAVRVEH